VEVGIGVEVRLVHEEALRPGRLRFHYQRRVLLDKGRTFRLVGLEQPFLRTLVAEAQPMQVAQARRAAEAEAAARLNELPDHLPVPVRQGDADLGRGRLHRHFQASLHIRVEGGGDHRFA